MSTAMNFGSKAFKPRAPEKGSFPLDHLGECKDFKEKFMKCLRDSSFDNSQCRLQSKDYLECRMKNCCQTCTEAPDFLQPVFSQKVCRMSDGADVRTQQEIFHRKHHDQLMAQEPLEKLGFKDLVDAPPNQADTDSEP